MTSLGSALQLRDCRSLNHFRQRVVEHQSHASRRDGTDVQRVALPRKLQGRRFRVILRRHRLSQEHLGPFCVHGSDRHDRHPVRDFRAVGILSGRQERSSPLGCHRQLECSRHGLRCCGSGGSCTAEQAAQTVENSLQRIS